MSPPTVADVGPLFVISSWHCPGITTCTGVEHVAVPPAPVTVSVYVVDCCGETLRVPAVETVPMPWSRDALDAFVDDQVRVEL